MSILQFRGLLSADGMADGTIVSGLTVRHGPAGPKLFWTSATDGALQAFGLADGHLAQGTADDGILASARRVSLDLGGQVHLLPGGLVALMLGDAGQPMLSAATLYSGVGGFAGYRVTLLPVDLGDRVMVYAAGGGAGGITAFSPEGALNRLSFTAQTPAGSDQTGPPGALAPGPVSALARLVIGGQDWLFAADTARHAVSAYRINADGGLTATASLGAAQGLGIAAPSALEPVRIAGEDYLILTAAGSSSISVIRVLPGGQMVATDHLVDTRETRFAGASALATVSVDGRVHVLVAGSDDGISLFVLLPGGRLVYLSSLVQIPGMVSGNITRLAATHVGGEIQVFAATEGQAVLSQFSIDVSGQGLSLRAGPGNATLTGGAGGDLLQGGPGRDELTAGAGDDILVDGTGEDRLTGGAGRDIFVLVADGATDHVLDFEPGRDRLDLSAFQMLYSVAQLDIRPTATGAEIRFGAERIVITTADRTPLTAAMIRDADVVLMTRPPGLTAGPQRLILTGSAGDDLLTGQDTADWLFGYGGADTLRGGPGEDSLIGGAGDDWLLGGPGADLLDGGPGLDWVSYLGATEAVTVVMRAPGLNRGHAAGDRFVSVENLQGTAFADDLRGDDLANEIRGHDGNDRLFGNDGGDTMLGGTGNDWIYGGAGDDSLFGMAGDDWLHGGPGADLLDGGPGRDWANYLGAPEGLRVSLADPALNTGHAFGDRYVGVENLLGSAFSDTLSGDDEANEIRGHDGHDLILGGAGDDTLRGGGGNDTLTGGAGADVFVFVRFQGDDRITDFQPGIDRILLAPGMAPTIGQSGENTALGFAGGHHVILLGVAPEDFLPADIGFF